MPRLLRLVLFGLRQLSLYGLSKAGADMFGGTERRHRVAAHLKLRDQAAEALHDELAGPGRGTPPVARARADGRHG